MKHLLLILVCVFTVLSTVPVGATVFQRDPQDIGCCQVVAFTTGSLATNAEDTLVVKGVNPSFLYRAPTLVADTTAATASTRLFTYTVQLEGLAGTGGAGTTDSLDVATDISWDGRNWIQKVAAGTTDATNASTTYDGSWSINSGSATPFPYIRFRLQNLGAATGRMGVTVSWERFQCN